MRSNLASQTCELHDLNCPFCPTDSLPRFNFPKRRETLLAVMEQNECTALLVSDPANVAYLTGFAGGDSYLYLDVDGNCTLISDGRYAETIQEDCPDIGLYLRPIPITLPVATGKFLNKSPYASIAIESHSMTHGCFETITKKLKSRTIYSTGGLVEQLRECKDEAEIAAIEKAIAVAQTAFTSVCSKLSRQMTEKDVADELEYTMRKLGASQSSFSTIVGAGARAALPHGVPSSAKIGDSQFVLIDWGANVEGYVSDLTRVLVNQKARPKLTKVYKAVLSAQRAAIAAIAPGVAMEKIDAAARDVLNKAGYAKEFSHSLGHGFGMQVHESIRLAKSQDRPLKEGMVVTVEPGVYLPGWGGIRIEDDCLVTKDGVRVLSNLPTALEDSHIAWID